MTTLKKLLRFTETFAPCASAEAWDNVGILAGSGEEEISFAILALDITPAVVENAHALGADLIISHHPVIFEPLSAIIPGTAPALLAQYQIAALCLHTNLDRADDKAGVNRALGDALGLKNTRFFPEDFLLVGELEAEMSCGKLASFIKERLGAPDVRFTDSKKTLKTLAVSSGGGGEGIELVEKYPFDAFLTGEMKHHQYLYANARGIAAFDAGHYATENIVLPPLKDKLEREFPDVAFSLSDTSPCPYAAL